MQPPNPTGLNCTVATVATNPARETDGFIAAATLYLGGLTFALIVAQGAGPDALQSAARAIAGNTAANSA